MAKTRTSSYGPSTQRTERHHVRSFRGGRSRLGYFDHGDPRVEDVNAFTFGERHFVFFDGLASAPREVVAVVITHEAHAELGHSSSLGERLVGSIQSSNAGTFARFSGGSRGLGLDQCLRCPRYSQEFGLADAEAVEILREIGLAGLESMVRLHSPGFVTTPATRILEVASRATLHPGTHRCHRSTLIPGPAGPAVSAGR